MENSGGWVSWVISRKMLAKCSSCTFLPAAETEVLTQTVIEDGRNGLGSSRTGEKMTKSALENPIINSFH